MPLLLLLLPLLLLPTVTAGILDTGCHEDFYSRPECVDRPEGYFCDCGPGFVWNSYSCVSEAVDSRMVFESRANTSYAVINNRIKIPPELRNFTVATFVKVRNVSESGTVFAYRVDGVRKATLLRYEHRRFVIEASADSRSLRPHVSTFAFDVADLAAGEWLHVAWTSRQLSNGSSRWHVFTRTPRPGAAAAVVRKLTVRQLTALPGHSEIFLGQAAPDADNKFDARQALVGEISHFNVWNFALDDEQVEAVFSDCLHRYCGNEVEWSDLRYGTRGSVTLSWPSGVTFGGSGSCTTVTHLQQTCDLTCSLRMGAQCKAGIDSNIQWPRTKANSSARVACPLAEQPQNDTEPQLAARICSKNKKQQGAWGQPHFLNCVGQEHLLILNETNSLVSKGETCQVTVEDKLRLLHLMRNVTQRTAYTNPMDLHVMIEALENVTRVWQRRHDCSEDVPQLDKLKQLFTTVLQLANSLMSGGNTAAWNMTRPPAQECRHLLQTLHNAYAHFVTDLLRLRLKSDGRPAFSDMFHLFSGENIVVKVSAFDPRSFSGDALPDTGDELRLSAAARGLGTIGFQGSIADLQLATSQLLLPKAIFSILALYPRAHQLLPHVHLKSDWKRTLGTVPRIEDNINAAVYHSLLFINDVELRTLPIPVRTQLKIMSRINISDAHCVRLDFHNPKDVHWSREACWMEKLTESEVKCACNSTGLQSLTTDMYNEELNRRNDTVRLLAYPSYIGCGVSTALCFVTCILLVYFRASTNTARIHQNFSLAIACGQLAFVLGIDKTWDVDICFGMSLLIHYCFLASFCWLMNEAFNLYIVITYAAHAHQHDSEEGGMWRYYLIGWIFPGALVAAFRMINGKTYLAKHMCCTSSIWLYAGPAISIVAITVMVLVFTAKEHHESSYTKDEKSNRAIAIHAKALWSQVILLSVAWSFAFVSIAMQDIIVKLLFAMFNCLQGVFFVVFYFLLNEEVQNKYLERQKQRLMALQELQGDGEEEEEQSELRLVAGGRVEESATSARQRRHVRRRSGQSQRLDSGDDNSDCEMIVTSV